jgi:hypothetical protein
MAYMLGGTPPPCQAVRLSVSAGDKDPLRRYFEPLMQVIEDPVVIRHDGGHTIPCLEGDDLRTLRRFLEARLDGEAAVGEEATFGRAASDLPRL